ncbi:hypothetical protein GUITHDRAFT_82856 [Guillardia theta CCMP2712]|uniref:Kinesin motor domain-containing protein n=1 Tax=Guillardia theta (strain CCMP2712) TaxID=905079 RepID=L1I759_GUITC|nr:hypothetical protein GUITHDRAFT_82856 [Guillardia theta CCMP2712]EKX31709.1 hypothetical protein GUITHDRAFT_82856 [Guillardia theta CCMP2712]|eukprot:XP_005818689.1 hypothetical protein GUITHDRAFT_82856 [Guillardia theta CCMP2712]
MCCPGTGLRDFQFDEVFDETSQQSQVYSSCASDLVSDFINGRNACIFAYGQTGSGKTHTIFGPDLHSVTNVRSIEEENSGLVPRVSKEILSAAAMRNSGEMRCELFLSYVEVFGDQVSNLLKDNKPVGMWHGVAHKAIFMEDCSVKESSSSSSSISRVILAGQAKRRAATAMNERSTRAHNLIFFLCKQVVKQTDLEISSHLCIADLGGSEQVFNSYVVKDERFQEACNINLGLLALKTCIRSLIQNSDEQSTDSSYVPFQDSRLTMLLSSALGGNCRTAVVVTVSPERRNAVETLHSLRFGEECSQVVLRSLDRYSTSTTSSPLLPPPLSSALLSSFSSSRILSPFLVSFLFPLPPSLPPSLPCSLP